MAREFFSFASKAKRRAARQYAVAVSSVGGPTGLDLSQAVIEQVGDLGWRIRVDSRTLGWGFVDREAAETYLAGLVERQQRSKGDADGK